MRADTATPCATYRHPPCPRCEPVLAPTSTRSCPAKRRSLLCVLRGACRSRNRILPVRTFVNADRQQPHASCSEIAGRQPRRALKLSRLIQLAPVKHLVSVDPMRLRHCRNRHPGLPRLFHNEPLLLRRPELTDPSSSNNRLSRFHRVPRTHGIKPCLQRACRKKNALSRRPTVAFNYPQVEHRVEIPVVCL